MLKENKLAKMKKGDFIVTHTSSLEGATSLSKMTFSITTLSIMIFSIIIYKT
jgi:hypothetical protein